MKLRVKFVPESIRVAREERLLTQEEAAAQVGVSPRTWQNWESGRVEPRARHQRAINEWLVRADHKGRDE